MTRPQKESDMKREHRVTIRLTDTEFSIIENTAEQADMTISEYMRKQIMEGQVNTKFEIVADVKEIKKEYKILITITSVLIMLSTVFIKQHVIVDVLGAFIIVPMYYIIRKKKINLEESGIYAKIFCQKKRTK